MDDIVTQYVRMVGYAPIGLKDVLNILKHPDMKELVIAWLSED